MVKGIWYFFLLLFNFKVLDFQAVKYLALWTAFKNRLKCQKINIFLILNHCAAANTSIHMHGCNRKFYST